MRGYKDCLEAAGAIVHTFESFGSYQGEWAARVTYKGETGYVLGSYGSCSGCDAYEAEFESAYDPDENDLKERMKTFGESYLDPLRSAADVYNHFIAHAEWDEGSQEALKWLEANDNFRFTAAQAVHNSTK